MANFDETVRLFVVQSKLKSKLGNFKFKSRLKWAPRMVIGSGVSRRCCRTTMKIVEGMDFRLDATIWVMLDLDVIERIGGWC